MNEDIKLERVLLVAPPLTKKEIWLFENGLVEIKIMSRDEIALLYPEKAKDLVGL